MQRGRTGLKRGLRENTVIAPYATALAAMVDPQRAMRNFERLTAIGAYTAVDQGLRLIKGDRRDAHSRPQLQLVPGTRGGGIEIAIQLRCNAAVGAIILIEAEGECRCDRHAIDPVRSRPGQRVGLYRVRQLIVDRSLELCKLGRWYD